MDQCRTGLLTPTLEVLITANIFELQNHEPVCANDSHSTTGYAM